MGFEELALLKAQMAHQAKVEKLKKQQKNRTAPAT
jgi:hypothetical protein